MKIEGIGTIPIDLVKALAIIGFLMVGFFVGFLLILTFSAIKEAIEHLLWRHKYKHRFDKEPTAKCYCKDCSHHAEDNRCLIHSGWYTADEWFCWGADPLKKEDERRGIL